MTEESVIKRQICEYLEMTPDCVFTLTPGIQAGKKIGRSKYMPKGWPDVSGVIKFRGQCRPFFIEVKTPTGKLSEEQRELLHHLDELGAIAFVARSVEDVRIGFEIFR